MDDLMLEEVDLVTIKEASEWASQYLQKEVTTSNISYLLQYGKIRKYSTNGTTCLKQKDLLNYYESFYGKREIEWKKKLGDDIDWRLSFDFLKEADTTKHVHRLHPYKGKFIPQLVEYFLDSHTDEFKKEVFFRPGDIVLDPFCGSGTTLVQSSELGMHAIGIDVSAFNALISNVKISKYDFVDLHQETQKITHEIQQFISDSKTIKFEEELLQELAKFNDAHFPSPDFKYKVKRKEIDEDKYGDEKAKNFLTIFQALIKKYDIQLRQERAKSFLDVWYLQHVRNEIDFAFNLIKEIKNSDTKKIITVILSRTIRSCRATTHSDLATLKEPVTTTYYCSKHGKICKPLFSIFNWWDRYSKDTLFRLTKFDKLKTKTYQRCLAGDSMSIDIIEGIQEVNPMFASIVKQRKIQGIFSSPPYVGLIDYHEQHAYAYDLFGFQRRDQSEIGPLFKGSGKDARDSYVEGIVGVLKNCKKFLSNNYHVFLVANDKYSLYPIIAEKAGMTIVNQYKRPVLNRTERDKGAYSETIFHLRQI